MVLAKATVNTVAGVDMVMSNVVYRVPDRNCFAMQIYADRLTNPSF